MNESCVKKILQLYGVQTLEKDHPIDRLSLGHVRHSENPSDQAAITANSSDLPPSKVSSVDSQGEDFMDAPLTDIASLEHLKEALEKFEGCRLKKTATHTVFSDGPKEADIMIIGEAPGADEDRLGKPFVGLSGQLLNKMFACIGYPREKLYISNIIPWRPPGNRQPTPAEVALCLPFIQRHIYLKQPKVIVLAGGTAAKSLLNCKEGITRLRGRWMSYTLPFSDSEPVPTLAMYHPAYLLRSPSKKEETWQDLLQLKLYLEKHSIKG